MQFSHTSVVFLQSTSASRTQHAAACAQANMKAGVEEDVDIKRYMNPAFNFNEGDHEELMEAAANVDAVLKGEKGDDVRPIPAEYAEH